MRIPRDDVFWGDFSPALKRKRVNSRLPAALKRCFPLLKQGASGRFFFGVFDSQAISGVLIRKQYLESLIRKQYLEFLIGKHPWLRLSRSELAVFAAIAPIDDHADSQPGEEAQPVHDGQADHEQHTADQRENRNNRPPRGTEATWTVGFAVTQNQHTDGDQHKGEERSDIGEIGEGADVE